MFKGLKAKIEVEQRTQSLSPSGKRSQQSFPDDHKQIDTQNVTINEESSPDPTTKTDSLNKPAGSGDGLKNATPDNLPGSAVGLSSLEDSNFAFLTSSLDPSISTTDLLARLREEVINLRGKLSKVVRERDQCNIKNDELQKTVKNLTNELSAEKALNQTLQNKLSELAHHGSSASNKSNGSSDLCGNRQNSNISIKPFNPTEGLSDELKNCEDIEQLRNMVLDMSRQVTEKNRQLKIRMQNVNDMKKALQKELFEHSKTQDELNKLQNLIHNRTDQNDSSTGDQNNQQFNNRNANSSDNSNHPTDPYDESESATNNNNHIAHRMITQLDGISCHSSASVDEFDGNMDIHPQKDVNHEYLRNVLFRYMTSTDTATTLHLVKALSVLMNFTPEQSTEIRKTMNARNSWLRLTK